MAEAGPSWFSRAFDRGVVVAAGVVAVVVAVVGLAGWESRPTWTAVLAAAAVPVLTRFPLFVVSRTGVVEVGFSSAVLVFLLVHLPSLDAMVVWVLAGTVAALSVPKPLPTRVFSAALVVLGGTAMTVTFVLVRGGAAPTGGRTALAVLLGCLAYVCVDLVLSWLGASLEARTPIRELVSRSDALLALCVLVGVASLGYLGALLASGPARWPLLLVLMPVAALVVASRATRTSYRDQRRLRVLLDAARERLDLDDAPRIVDAAVAHAAVLLGSASVVVRRTGPLQGEIGALLDTGREPTWLVGTDPASRAPDRRRDQEALEALAADTAESLARSRLLHELGQQAGTDALTGLANRGVFADEVSRAVAQGRDTGCPPAVLYLDLVAFKQVNDRFGHHVGDELVREVADQLTSCVRPGDVVARLGGDEFAVLVEGVADIEALLVLAQRAIDLVRVERVVDGHLLRVGASVGVAVADATTSPDDLLRNADMAMYEAKRLRRPAPVLYRQQLRQRSLERAELEADLRRALEGEELTVEYQPVLTLPDAHVHGLEALARWQHPQRGLLTASAFIEVAEEAGLVGQLGEWVLRRVLRDTPALVAAAGRPITMSVNVSARQLQDGALAEVVREVVEQGPAGARLVLELTESVAISRDRAVQRRLAQLVAAGASLALDDFGVGYSSVGYLRWLPVEVLKLDRSLLTSVTDDPRARSLVEAVLLMGHALGLTVVAEGVEQPEQWSFLADRGCAMAQGYLLARPMPAELTRHWLVERRAAAAMPAQRRPAHLAALPGGPVASP